MADTITTNYGFIKPDIGGSTDTWGDKVNDNLDDIDSTIKSVADSVVTVSNSLSTLASTVSGISTSLSFKADASSVYTKTQIDGFRTADQNAAKDASNLNAGTVHDYRLSARLGPYGEHNVPTNADFAAKTGGYMCNPATVNTPSPDWWYLRVEASSGVDVGQRFTRHSDGAEWTRRYLAGAWTSFKRIYQTAAEIQSLFPDYTSGEISIVPGGAFSVTHSLGVIPKVQAYLLCKVAEGGYSVGQYVPIKPDYSYIGAVGGMALALSATTCDGRFGSHTTPFDLVRLDTGAQVYLTNANWRLILRFSK